MRGRLSITRPAVAVNLAALVWCSYPAAAHPVLMTYIRHRVDVDAGPRNIDITVELTFHEMRSLSERRRMDRNHDGTLDATEIQSYLASISGKLDEGVRLSVAGRPVEVIPLYEPQLDLLGVEQVATSHHILRLSYFARTPAWLAEGSKLELVDALWPDAPWMGSVEANGTGGVAVEATSTGTVVSEEPGDAQPRVMHMRCSATPPIGRNAASPHRVAAPPLPAGPASPGSSKTMSMVKPWKGITAVFVVLLLAGGLCRRLFRPSATSERMDR